MSTQHTPKALRHWLADPSKTLSMLIELESAMVSERKQFERKDPEYRARTIDIRSVRDLVSLVEIEADARAAIALAEGGAQ